MSYDNEGRLASWQNTPGSSPTESASYLYDGAGQRVQQAVTASGATATTSYIGSLEEVTQSSGTTTTTAYYGSLAESVNGALSYLLSDGLGSVSEAVSTAGVVSATQLYGPYGAVRYQSGTLPTDKGYTGQRADTATSGLDYYGARSYDPVAGQFTSADTTLAGGLNRYAYVAGNPETRTDPSGHMLTCPTGGCSTGTNPTTNPTTKPTQVKQANTKVQSQAGCDESCQRDNWLQNLQKKAAGFALLAILANALGVLVTFVSEGTLGKLEAVVLIATLFTEALPYAGTYFGGSQLYKSLSVVAGALNYVGGLALTAIGAYRLIGWAAQFSINAAILAFQAATQGVPFVAEKVGAAILGGALLFLTNGFAAQFWGLYNATNAEAEREREMPISTWCRTVGSSACSS